ncbi:hypothetical protein P885DRAFT_67297 [Corynascus similis CBS 632.67]
MSSTYTLYPPPGSNTTTASRDKDEQPRNNATTQDPQFLNPFSPQVGSGSSSPGFSIHTPADSVYTDFTEADDPFFGVDLSAPNGASPSFLADDVQPFDDNGLVADSFGVLDAPTNTQRVSHAAPYLPLSPDRTPSLPGGSPNSQLKEDTAARSMFPDLTRTSIAPKDLSLTHQSSDLAPGIEHRSVQLTPQTNGSANSSDDGVAPVTTMRSPRVTVSHWDRDNNLGISQSLDANQTEARGSSSHPSTARDGTGRWVPDQVTGQTGLPPTARSADQVPSINDLAAQRELEERKQKIDEWIERSANSPDSTPQVMPDVEDDGIPQREISLGDRTENKPVPGQTYYLESGGGPLTREDLEIMRQGNVWEDAPIPFSISQSNAYQPKTSQDAMLKYEQMCRDNASIVSRAATWGTRRLSLPSLIDTEVQVTGNLFKKLSISRGDARRPSLLGNIRSLVRRPSNSGNKRNRPDPDDASSFLTEPSTEKKDSQAKLAPPSPKPGWSRKQSVPSINTAFVDVGSKFASIGTTHARTSSVSATSVTSPKSPGGRSLSVKKPLRLRSKSETSGIVDLWKRSGGPPVPNTKVNAPEAEDDDEDEDDLYEDGDMKSDSDKLIDDITPTFAGFQQHVVRLNPMLGTPGNYLVDRIAHQQLTRYKHLLNLRVKHLQAVSARNCACGSMCIASGGSANMLDSKGEQRGLDPLSSRYDGSDGDITPVEGLINQDSFPQDIPMPPTTSLPAEFECQLCFTAKKFQKPSDWTKHVHEDVQPFTCTWDRCKDPKMFKRKADWVRHENEGHRHLEWWLCDVDDCHHKCYRRDNFLQHLVREHKFVEPKVKTKAAIKKAAGGMDPTWAKVEQCHYETDRLPQQEPCRFCGKTFPSWKKLTVHLAKHMEHISLPVLKLVAKKELDENSIISPVQDPPPRPFPADFSNNPDQHHAFGLSPTIAQPGQMPYSHDVPSLGIYSIPPPHQGYPASGFYNPSLDGLTHSMVQAQINMPAVPHQHHHPQHGFQSLNSPAAFPDLPATSAGTYMSAQPQASPNYMTMAPDLEPFPALSTEALGLGLQTSTGAVGQLPYANGGLTGEQHQRQQQQQQQQQQQPQHRQQHFTPQGSVSPYGPSPNMPQGGFF